MRNGRQAVRGAFGGSVSASIGAAVAGVLCIGLAFGPRVADARNDLLTMTVESAKSFTGRTPLLDVPFYMKGQSHPGEAESLGIMKTNKRTNAIGKSDDHACGIAFQSAIIQLQTRARQLGADAVVDIISMTTNVEFESPSEYRCAAGRVVANVALQGRAVKLR